MIVLTVQEDVEGGAERVERGRPGGGGLDVLENPEGLGEHIGAINSQRFVDGPYRLRRAIRKAAGKLVQADHL